MNEITRKSFYIFLAMLLGVFLFITIQRSVFLVLFLLGYDISTVVMSSVQIITTACAVVLGGWYGAWLGLVWYSAVYEEGSTRGLSRVLRDWSSSGRKKEEDGDWEIDDLVALESVDPKSKKPTLEYIEAGAIKWKGEKPFAAHEIHESAALGSSRRIKKVSPAKRK